VNPVHDPFRDPRLPHPQLLPQPQPHRRQPLYLRIRQAQLRQRRHPLLPLVPALVDRVPNVPLRQVLRQRYEDLAGARGWSGNRSGGPVVDAKAAELFGDSLYGGVGEGFRFSVGAANEEFEFWFGELKRENVQ